MSKTLEEQIKEKEQELVNLRKRKMEKEAKKKRFVTFEVQGVFHFSAKETYFCSEEEEEQIKETLCESFDVTSYETTEINVSESDVTAEIVETCDDE